MVTAAQVQKYRWRPRTDERFESTAALKAPTWYVMFFVDAVDAGAVHSCLHK